MMGAVGRLRIAEGTLLGLLGEGLILPTALVTAAFLARRLGLEGYGVFSLAAAVVVQLEWIIATVLGHATVRLIGAAEDWEPVAAAAVQLYLAAGLAAAVAVWAAAGGLAALLGEPALAGALRLFALDLPLFTLAHAHRSLLVGTGAFNHRALVTIVRLLVRLLLIVALVQAGLSLTGAILGCVGASLVELLLARRWVRPPLWSPPATVRPFLAQFAPYALPLAVSTLALGVFDRLDLLLLKALGGTAAQAGLYGAAQHLALLPGIFALAVSPLVLSAQSHAVRTGDAVAARRVVREAMRAVLCLAPLAAVVAGSGPALMGLIYGAPFAVAATAFGLLLFGQLALVLFSVASAALVAAGRLRSVVLLGIGLVTVATGALLAVIPRHGLEGAAAVTAAVSGLGAAGSVVAVRRAWGVLPPRGTMIRSAVAAGAGLTLALLWPASGIGVAVKLVVLGTAVAGVLVVLGEVRAADVDLARALFRRRLDGARAVRERAETAR